jgi:hypothetical protein
LIMALVLKNQPQSQLIAVIGVIFGLVMAMLWAIRLPQNESVLPEAAPAYASYTPTSTYPASFQSQLFVPPSPEPAPGFSQEKKYQDERGVQGFTFAKGNESVARSQDAFALDNDLRRYAVTDGVSRSFLPSYWARILSTHFVHQGQGVEDEAYFAEWLRECNNEWEQRAQQWIEQAEKRRQEQGLINATEWQQHITLGAQATLIGCTLLPAAKNGGTHIQVTAIGDANFFLVRHTHNGTWEYAAYPYTDPAAFGTTPNALATAAVNSPKRLQRTWSWIGKQTFEGQRGDYIVLATDAIAKWLLQQLQSGQEDWRCLLDPNTTSSTLGRLIFMERATRRLEDDDVTVLVVPL